VCTVVKKDRSLAGLVDAGYDNLEPLLDFRDWLKTFREDMSQRWKFKRDGSVRHTQSGSHIPGPFKLSVRRMILERLKETERDSGLSLISDREVARIQMLWLDDAMLLAQHGCTEDSWGWKHPHPPGTLAEPLPSSES
jgi:DNA sulfur modification protein DndC